MHVALLGVAGDDEIGDRVLDQAHTDGIDVSRVVRRTDTPTGLIVDVVDAKRHWHYLEDLPTDLLLGEADIDQAAAMQRAAPCTVVQLQQPSAARSRLPRYAARMVVLDGAPADDEHRDALLDAADVLRADAREAKLLTRSSLDTAADAVRAGQNLRRRHQLSFVALAIDDGNVFVWDDGHLTIPLVDTEVVDTTGAGDAMVAALVNVLCRAGSPQEAAQLAVAAAAATVGHPGGRPHLTPQRIDQQLNKIAG